MITPPDLIVDLRYALLDASDAVLSGVQTRGARSVRDLMNAPCGRSHFARRQLPKRELQRLPVLQ